MERLEIDTGLDAGGWELRPMVSHYRAPAGRRAAQCASQRAPRRSRGQRGRAFRTPPRWPAWRRGRRTTSGSSTSFSICATDTCRGLAQAMAGRGLSAWLAALARRTGPRLWSLLRALRPADYVLARLSQITPCRGVAGASGDSPSGTGREPRHAGRADPRAAPGARAPQRLSGAATAAGVAGGGVPHAVGPARRAPWRGWHPALAARA